jgi:hypothetical protein
VSGNGGSCTCLGTLGSSSCDAQSVKAFKSAKRHR